MTATTEVLARHGVRVTDQELAAELDRALSELSGADAISDTEMAYLAAHAGGRADRLLASFDPVAAHRDQALAKADAAAQLLRGLLTREAAANRLGIDASGVSRRVAGGRLWALPRTGRRIPAWQIHDGRLLPGLDAIIRALPADASPLAIAGFMTTAQEELGDVTPIDYVLAGGNAEAVAEMVGELDRW